MAQLSTPTPPSMKPPVQRDLRATVIAALDEQVDCYRRLAKLAQIQHEHVQQSCVEGLLKVLKSREVLLEQIARLEATVAPAKRGWSEFLAPMPADQRRRVESIVAEAKSLLEAITNSDRNDVLALQQRQLNLGKQIKQANTSRQVNRMYGVAAYGSKQSQMDIQR